MGENSKVEWTDHTFNGVIGCEHVGPGCANCYAETLMAKRLNKVDWGNGKPRYLTGDQNWNLPLKWNKQAQSAAHRPRVFACSLSDVFDNAWLPEWRTRLFKLIRDTPNLDWLLLTKRIGNAKHMLPEDWGSGYDNVWLGATVCNQHEADRDVVKLLRTPAKIRFLSVEPMLEAIQLPTFSALSRANLQAVARDANPDQKAMELLDLVTAGSIGVDWVICGGESGPNARDFDVWWARHLRDQCTRRKVPFFMKQLGGKSDKRSAWEDLPEDLRIRSFPLVRRVTNGNEA